jgi:hypothetical protein
MRGRYKWPLILAGFLSLLAVFCVIPRGTSFRLSNGGQVHIRGASFGRSLFSEASATISYRQEKVRTGKVILWQDIFDGPVAVISSRDTNVLLCLYDYDTGFRLFRIDMSKLFKPISSDTDLKHILFTSTWDIEEGSPDEWQQMLVYLSKVPPSIFAQQSVHVGFRSQNPNSILSLLAYQGINVVSNQ